jgi:hypothetical protein
MAGDAAAAQKRAMAGILREASDRYFVIIIGQTYRARTHKASRPVGAEPTGPNRPVSGPKPPLYMDGLPQRTAMRGLMARATLALAPLLAVAAASVPADAGRATLNMVLVLDGLRPDAIQQFSF